MINLGFFFYLKCCHATFCNLNSLVAPLVLFPWAPGIWLTEQNVALKFPKFYTCLLDFLLTFLFRDFGPSYLFHLFAVPIPYLPCGVIFKQARAAAVTISSSRFRAASRSRFTFPIPEIILFHFGEAYPRFNACSPLLVKQMAPPTRNSADVPLVGCNCLIAWARS